jgi:DNA-binding MarR family transcriptional regulator
LSNIELVDKVRRVSTAAKVRQSAAQEAWDLIRELWTQIHFPRVMAVCAEYDLAKQQAIALVHLDPARPMPMSELAATMFCDASNITGIADRLESRGLVERVPAAYDRRVKTLALTPEGERVREQLAQRLHTPPPNLTALSAADQRALRDVLRRALDS